MSEFLLYRLDDQRFGIPLHVVNRVERAAAPTAVPGAPEVVRGVLDVRGTAVPVFDLRLRLGLPPMPLRPSDHLVLATTSKRVVALVVDRVEGLTSVAPERLNAASKVVPGLKHVAGILRLPDGLVLVTDLDAFLSLEEECALDKALEGAP